MQWGTSATWPCHAASKRLKPLSLYCHPCQNFFSWRPAHHPWLPTLSLTNVSLGHLCDKIPPPVNLCLVLHVSEDSRRTTHQLKAWPQSIHVQQVYQQVQSCEIVHWPPWGKAGRKEIYISPELWNCTLATLKKSWNKRNLHWSRAVKLYIGYIDEKLQEKRFTWSKAVKLYTGYFEKKLEKKERNLH